MNCQKWFVQKCRIPQGMASLMGQWCPGLLYGCFVPIFPDNFIVYVCLVWFYFQHAYIYIYIYTHGLYKQILTYCVNVYILSIIFRLWLDSYPMICPLCNSWTHFLSMSHRIFPVYTYRIPMNKYTANTYILLFPSEYTHFDSHRDSQIHILTWRNMLHINACSHYIPITSYPLGLLCAAPRGRESSHHPVVEAEPKLGSHHALLHVTRWKTSGAHTKWASAKE
jgi:hypothetical protein